jgi:pimeloyl-ACP methyl ester carboxylesterase
MATFVLVGGAWMGGWVWANVTRRLRALGHDVYPATLTGLGDRVHLGGPHVDLDTHITDVVNLMAYADLADVFLVGHSFAGSVVTGVADRVPDQLAALVFCDSGPLGAGQSWLDLQSPAGQAALRKEAQDDTDGGWRLQMPEFTVLGRGASLRGLGEPELALMRQKATPQPFGTYAQPLRLRRTGPPSYRRVMILCDNGKQLMTAVRSGLAAGDPRFAAFGGDDWEYPELDTGHWPMLSQPAELTEVFDRLTRA